VSYIEKTLINDLRDATDPDSDEFLDSLGLFTAFEIIAVIFASLFTLLRSEFGLQPGYAVALGVATGFAYKYLIMFLARTPMVYLAATVSIAFWVGLTYWLSSSVMELSSYWPIGLSIAMLAWVAREKKRTMINSFSRR
jgi:hypothetical protein